MTKRAAARLADATASVGTRGGPGGSGGACCWQSPAPCSTSPNLYSMKITVPTTLMSTPVGRYGRRLCSRNASIRPAALSRQGFNSRQPWSSNQVPVRWVPANSAPMAPSHLVLRAPKTIGLEVLPAPRSARAGGQAGFVGARR